jgi:hypothetical protein
MAFFKRTRATGRRTGGIIHSPVKKAFSLFI